MERDPTGVDTQWFFVAILQAFFSRAAIVNAHCKDGRVEDRSIMAGAVAINSVCLPRRESRRHPMLPSKFQTQVK
jgi:hypothetical protein